MKREKHQTQVTNSYMNLIWAFSSVIINNNNNNNKIHENRSLYNAGIEFMFIYDS